MPSSTALQRARARASRRENLRRDNDIFGCVTRAEETTPRRGTSEGVPRAGNMTHLISMYAGLAVVNLTSYHVNPLHEGVIPVNMNTADLRGDIFFDLRSKTLPIECASGLANKTHDCSNQEVVDADLVVTKLIMTVYGDFGEYARCNACNSKDVDPSSGLPCHGQKYLCVCGDYPRQRDCTGQKPVGAENVTTQFGGRGSCNWDTWIKYPWSCWGQEVVHKTAGPGVNMWYSSTSAGWCGAPGASPATCTWSAEVLKIVNKTCSDNSVYSAVEEYDAQHDGRFAKCPHYPQTGPRRNTSDPCWIYSFYATVLGPDALMPGGAVAGMPAEILDQAFDRPFADEAHGGCPAIPPPQEAPARLGSQRRYGHRSFGVLSGPQLQASFRAAAQLAAEEVAERRRRA